MSQIKEIYSVNHKNITIYIDIDYKNDKISLVEPESIEKSRYIEKKWLFAGRGEAYCQGWKNILEAMTHAISDAEKKMCAYKDERSEEQQKKVVEDHQLLEKRESKKK